jgi:FixJ family two-component response regulator
LETSSGGVAAILHAAGLEVERFVDARALLESAALERAGCLVIDVEAVGRALGELQRKLRARPIIVIGSGEDVATAVEAMKSGAVDFLARPLAEASLIHAVRRALELDEVGRAKQARDVELAARLEALSPREREVCELAAKGHLNKEIAVELGISEATVKFHRGRAMTRLGVRSAAELGALLAHFRAIAKYSR